MAKQYIIYKHTNLINNKVYIGQTSVKPESRWRKDGQGYKGSPHFYAAIQKYGWNNFRHEIILITNYQQNANELEKYYIKKYNSTNEKYGYNILNGGKGYSHTQEEKIHLSNIMKEKWKTKEFRDKINTSDKCKNRNMAYCSKKNYCIETGKIFSSQSEAAKWAGLKSTSGISKCCVGERKTAGGYHWKFYENGVDLDG